MTAKAHGASSSAAPRTPSVQSLAMTSRQPARRTAVRSTATAPSVPTRRSSASARSAPATTKAEENGAIRLRDAALELFGQNGFAGTNVRALADRAGVTAGLVKHHYGSKDGLREAVDRYVLASIQNTWSELLHSADRAEVVDHMSIRIQGFQTLFQANPHIGRYIRRTLVEQTPASNAFFDGLAEVSNTITDAIRHAGLVRTSSDPEAQGLYALLCGLMPVMLSRHIERHLGVSLRSDDGAKRWAAIDYEVQTQGILIDPDQTGR
jgi:TetR/AcrR family transcriptional regulator, regulator of cefoperazone and chloramphenicol sensitivity